MNVYVAFRFSLNISLVLALGWRHIAILIRNRKNWRVMKNGKFTIFAVVSMVTINVPTEV